MSSGGGMADSTVSRAQQTSLDTSISTTATAASSRFAAAITTGLGLLQLCIPRYLGAFLVDLTETPSVVFAVLARQLGIEPPGGFAEYCAGRRRWDHAIEIRQ